MRRNDLIFMLVGSIAALTQSSAIAAKTSLTLAWNAPATNEPAIAGYVVYYGTTTRNYTNQAPVGNTTTCTISNLVEGTTYFFAATALGTSGLESDYSDELVYPSGIKIVSPTSEKRYTNNAGTTVTFSVSAVGSLPLSYRWYRCKDSVTNALSDRVDLWGATTATLTLSNVFKAEEASYWVVVTNALSSAVSSNAFLMVVDPAFKTQPAEQIVNGGLNAVFSATVAGSLPLSYRWYRGAVALSDGGRVSGATSAILTLSMVTPNDAGAYSMVVTNEYGRATSQPATLTVRAPTETTPPNVIVLPNQGFECETNNAMKVFGTAADAAPGAVAQVLVQVNGGNWQSASMTNPVPERAAWTRTVTLVTGTNTLDVKALDSSGNVSKVISRTFFLRVPSPLGLVRNGSGTMSVLTPPPYFVRRSYGLQVTPAAGYLLSNVVAQAGGASSILYTATPEQTAQEGAKIRFAMQTNLTLVANFMPNQFIGAAGNYHGLYSDPAGVAHASAGYVTFKTTSRLKFSGSLYVEGEKVRFSGGFDLAGVGTLKKPAARKGMAQEPINIVAQLDLTGGRRMRGTVSNGAWTSGIDADQQVAYASNSWTWGLTGRQYTMVVPGSPNVAVEPGGDGYSLITIAADASGLGWISAGGYFGDGEKVAPLKVPLTPSGRWPFYAPLYKTYRPATNPATATLSAPAQNGSVTGWLLFTNSNVQGDLEWNKARWTNGIYDGGFSNRIRVAGSPYVAPALLSGAHVIAITNGLVTVSGGNLAAPALTEFDWTDLNRLVFAKALTTGNPNAIALTVNYKSGEVKGSFLSNPPDKLSKRSIFGAVLQNLDLAWGTFKGTNQSGSILLQGN